MWWGSFYGDKNVMAVPLRAPRRNVAMSEHAQKTEFDAMTTHIVGFPKCLYPDCYRYAIDEFFCLK
jgi:hypothetical protein